MNQGRIADGPRFGNRKRPRNALKKGIFGQSVASAVWAKNGISTPPATVPARSRLNGSGRGVAMVRATGRPTMRLVVNWIFDAEYGGYVADVPDGRSRVKREAMLSRLNVVSRTL